MESPTQATRMGAAWVRVVMAVSARMTFFMKFLTGELGLVYHEDGRGSWKFFGLVAVGVIGLDQEGVLWADGVWVMLYGCGCGMWRGVSMR